MKAFNRRDRREESPEIAENGKYFPVRLPVAKVSGSVFSAVSGLLPSAFSAVKSF
jgi:hypothetical protein